MWVTNYRNPPPKSLNPRAKYRNPTLATKSTKTTKANYRNSTALAETALANAGPGGPLSWTMPTGADNYCADNARQRASLNADYGNWSIVFSLSAHLLLLSIFLPSRPISSSPFSFPLLTFHALPALLFSHFPFLLLRSSPLKSSSGVWGALLPQRVLRLMPQPKSNLVHFIWHLVHGNSFNDFFSWKSTD